MDVDDQLSPHLQFVAQVQLRNGKTLTINVPTGVVDQPWLRRDLKDAARKRVEARYPGCKIISLLSLEEVLGMEQEMQDLGGVGPVEEPAVLDPNDEPEFPDVVGKAPALPQPTFRCLYDHWTKQEWEGFLDSKLTSEREQFIQVAYDRYCHAVYIGTYQRQDLHCEDPREQLLKSIHPAMRDFLGL